MTDFLYSFNMVISDWISRRIESISTHVESRKLVIRFRSTFEGKTTFKFLIVVDVISGWAFDILK